MGEVIDFLTGEVIKTKRERSKTGVVNILDSFHQRKHQFSGVVMVALEKNTGRPIFAESGLNDWDYAALRYFILQYCLEILDE